MTSKLDELIENLPDGLVGDNNLSPLLLGELLGNSVELLGDNVDGLVGLTLLGGCISLGSSHRVTASSKRGSREVKKAKSGKVTGPHTSRVSPMQKITLRPPSMAALTLRAMN